MYTIYVTFKCRPAMREAFVERVKQEGILDKIRNEDGCHRYDYYFSAEDDTKLLLLEAWESKRHQEIHMTQPHMADLRAFNDDYIESAAFGEYELKS